MTETLARPSRALPARPTGPLRSPLVVGLTAALWAVLAGLVALALPVLLVWASDGRSGSGAAAAVRAVGQVWLVAHGTTVEVPGGPLGLSPLGLAALPLLLLVRAGRHAARERVPSTLRDGVVLVAAVAGPYAVAAAVVAGLSASEQVRPVAWEALLGAFVVAVLGAGAGVLRGSRLVSLLRRRAPARALGLGRATLAVAAVLLGAGALLVGASLALHAGRAASLAAATGPGVVGGVALFVLVLALVPNAVVLGAAWWAGPGFAVGVGTTVSPWATSLGDVPALPLLAALPSTPAPGWVGATALLVPLLAGALGGRLVGRSLPRGSSRWRAAGEAALVAPCAGAAMALLALAAGGPLGAGRLAEVGPTPWLVGLTVAALVALPAVAAGALSRRPR